MIRRFNSTGRRTIAKKHATVTLRRLDENGRGSRGGAAPGGTETTWCYDLKLDLTGHEFPADARIRVEAWRGNTVQRWDWGTVGAPVEPSEPNRILRDVPETSQFRVSVIARGDSGRLLGLADKLRPRLPIESLLPLVPEDLGGEVWRLDYGQGDDMVVLKVNRELPDFDHTIRHDAMFRGLVMPQVLRSILERALLVDREDPDDAEGRWSPWLDLAKAILPGETPPTLDADAQDDQIEQVDHWITSVVAAFSADKVKALEGCRRAWQAK